MIRTTIGVASALAVALISLTACTAGSPPPGSPGTGLCEPGRARDLLGQARVDDQQARRFSGASEVRQIAPGDPITRDLQPNRVTVTTDPATGRIVDVGCF